MPTISDQLRLTDFMDLGTLQEIQDSFASVANVNAVITDAEGNRLTSPAPTSDFLHRQRAIAAAEEAQDGPQREGREYVAPIIVNEHRLGMIRMRPLAGTVDDAKLTAMAEKFGIDPKQVKAISSHLLRMKNTRPAAIQFLYLLANAIARLCYQEFQLRQRIDELTAVYNVATMLSDARDLNQVLQRTVRVVCEVMGTKAASIRLIDRERDELVIKAVYNLSPEYLAKGPVGLSTSEIEKIALSPQGYEYVRDMATDPRVQYQQEAAAAGIASMLSVGMRYKGTPIGVLHVYTAAEQVFNQIQIELLKAVAAQAAGAIENARLAAEAKEADALERQVQMAASIQQRMLPQKPPCIPGVDLAALYAPCFELGGDFYDFIPLQDDNVGLVMADVSGKGIPASLIMASVRAALRAQVDNVYYLYEVIRRVNLMLCRDAGSSEFVTLFYGVLDARNRRLTYCNAGHPPPLLLRDGTISELGSDNLVLGVDPHEAYKQSFVELKSGDTLLLYTDGLADAMNFQQQMFGRQRIQEALKKNGPTAELLAQNILWEMRRFVGLAKRSDDVSMMVAKVG